MKAIVTNVETKEEIELVSKNFLLDEAIGVDGFYSVQGDEYFYTLDGAGPVLTSDNVKLTAENIEEGQFVLVHSEYYKIKSIE